MKHPPSQETVVETYLDGVKSIEQVVDSFDEQAWSKTTCGQWSAADTVRHLLGVTEWYAAWLDRAIQAESTLPFGEDELDARATRVVDSLQDIDPATAVEQFVRNARSHVDRVQEQWDLPFAYPFGVVTAGLHLGIAATEWHLHAWDLSAHENERHQPADPASLFIAAGAAVSAGTGGVRGRVIGAVIPFAAKRSPWATLLKKSGR